jgi:hypothetical protein
MFKLIEKKDGSWAIENDGVEFPNSYENIKDAIERINELKLRSRMENQEKPDTPPQLGYSESFNNCTEEMAKVLEKHFPEVIEIEDMSRINNLVDEEIIAGGRRQHEQNLADEINGGSR